MKRYMFLVAIAACLGTSSLKAQSIERLWEVKDNLPTPESVLFHAKNGMLYVSLIDGGASDKDGKGGIAILNTDGSTKDASWITGLNAPKGLAIFNDLLYIADISSIIVVDIVSGNIVDEISIPGSTFLNDVTVDDRGIVYVSDTRDGKIYQVQNGSSSLYLENAPNVNGLKFDKGKLLALVGTELWAIDANKQIKVIAKGFEKGGDGLEPIGNGDYLVTCWPGIVYYVNADGSIVKMKDVQGVMNTADLGYNPKTKIMYIPTFSNNSVIAYQLK
ncbi:SMP-30/gluconolactonase/LRE family protein [Sphingobacterium rhinopitheci]|uniref:SMP-30/gluconolactonase/LRE family protein n=1 Tax=Sphingobacterium rhinopitheci TaxID=2781960 RepID=UPI001F529CBF|nr:ATP-binding protein [Sphingobacterium rhinopitheci]MCI0921833.1 ATP-binding protein [Sphingobacterium rhinopitheci]